MSRNNKDVVPADERYEVHDVPMLADEDMDVLAQKAERRIESINKIKRAALGVTNSRDWTDQGGKPYLQVSGAEKIARLFGISWRIDEPVYHQEEDGHYSFTYKGYFSFGGAEIEAIGARGSKDPFFSKKGGEYRPVGEIDRNNVKKAAYTNCIGNGVTRILGIRNMDWSDLEEFAKIKKDSVSRVNYRQQGGSQSGGQGKQELTEKGKESLDKTRHMILEMVDGDANKAQDMLERLTSFTDNEGNRVRGKRSLEQLSEKAIHVVYGKAKKEYEDWKENEEGGDDGGAAETGQQTIE